MKMMDERDFLVIWAVHYWWVVAGPGSASWRSSFRLYRTDLPTRYYLGIPA